MRLFFALCGSKLQPVIRIPYNITVIKLQRFFVPRIDGVLPDTIVHQILHVLRLKENDCVILLDNSGKEHTAKLCAYDKGMKKNQVLPHYKVIETHENAYEPSVRVTLSLALLKSQERFEWAVQKATELGISAIRPLITERTQVKNLRNIERLRRIMQEASEQCERGIIPTLLPVKKFEELTEDAEKETGRTIVFCHELSQSVFNTFPPLAEEIEIVIGPEGGFSEKESELITHTVKTTSHVHSISLGKRILRAETAAVTALSLILPHY